MYKQIIIARKDLNMSSGKLAAQVAHGSMAFLTWMVRNNTKKLQDNLCVAYTINKDGEKELICYRRPDLYKWATECLDRGERYFYAKPVNPNDPCGKLELCEPSHHYTAMFNIDNDLYEQWLKGEYTKCVLQAKNRDQLLKVRSMADELGMKEGEDYFLIYDNCHTELMPEEDGKTLTVIGFRPMESEIIDRIGKKYHLYM